MGFCSGCGKELADDVRFCPGCGKPIQAGVAQPANARPAANQDWCTFNDFGSQPARIVGAIGAVLAFISGFLPWAQVRVSLNLPGFPMGDNMGMPGGASVTAQGHTDWAWLIALVSIAALVALFKKRAGIVLVLTGVAIAGYAVISAIVVSSDGGSPLIGVVLSLVGGALMVYSGVRTIAVDRG